MNGGGSIAIAPDAADGDDHDVAEEVFAIARMTRVGEGLKVRADGFAIDEPNEPRLREHRNAS
jgi:hypothetical protein